MEQSSRAPRIWGVNVEVSERLVTGQNPASAGPMGKAVVEVLEGKK